MGEIGLDRKEYLYDLSFCDLLCIERGYYRRHRAGWEQARLVAYFVRYCMGLSKGETAKPITDFCPFSWEKEPSIPISEEDKQELLNDMNNWSKFLASKKK